MAPACSEGDCDQIEDSRRHTYIAYFLVLYAKIYSCRVETQAKQHLRELRVLPACEEVARCFQSEN